MNFERLQARLGYTFGDRRILLQAMTHTSYGHEFLYDTPVSSRDNERLEFLGDAILDVIVSDILIEAYPSANEGQLSKMRAALVNEKTLAQVALDIKLNEVVRLGKGESLTGGSLKPSILSSTFEALIAGIYMDGGFNAVYPVVRFLFSSLLIREGGISLGLLAACDHKTVLQEWVQAKWKVTPVYSLISTQGPDHAKVFEVEVKMGTTVLAFAMGSSKKEAEQNSAKLAMEKLKSENNQVSRDL